MRYDATTFETPGAGRREAAASAASSAEAAANAMLDAARQKALTAIDEAFRTLVTEADFALGPVDGSSVALDELRELRRDLAGLVRDALAPVEYEIETRAERRAA